MREPLWHVSLNGALADLVLSLGEQAGHPGILIAMDGANEDGYIGRLCDPASTT